MRRLRGLSAGRRAMLLVVAVAIVVGAFPLAAGASGYCPAYYSFSDCFGGASQGYGYSGSSGSSWYQFGSSSGTVPAGYGSSANAACHDYFSYGTSQTHLFCGPAGIYRPIEQPPPSGGGGGGGSPPAAADSVDRILGAAINGTRAALNRDSCNAYISGNRAGDDDARNVFTIVQGSGRLRDSLDDGFAPSDSEKYASVDQVGVGSAGTIRLTLGFYAALNDPWYYNATMDTFSPPLTADEFRTMIVLHEVAHLTGANVHRDDATWKAFNYGIVANCLR